MQSFKKILSFVGASIVIMILTNKGYAADFPQQEKQKATSVCAL